MEIDTQGDSFFFAFPRAREAVAAAVQVQRTHARTAWPGEAVVRVGIGLHTGEPGVGDEGYLGLGVVRAARICGVVDGVDVTPAPAPEIPTSTDEAGKGASTGRRLQGFAQA